MQRPEMEYYPTRRYKNDSRETRYIREYLRDLQPELDQGGRGVRLYDYGDLGVYLVNQNTFIGDRFVHRVKPVIDIDDVVVNASGNFDELTQGMPTSVSQMLYDKLRLILRKDGSKSSFDPRILLYTRENLKLDSRNLNFKLRHEVEQFMRVAVRGPGEILDTFKVAKAVPALYPHAGVLLAGIHRAFGVPPVAITSGGLMAQFEKTIDLLIHGDLAMVAITPGDKYRFISTMSGVKKQYIFFHDLQRWGLDHNAGVVVIGENIKDSTDVGRAFTHAGYPSMPLLIRSPGAWYSEHPQHISDSTPSISFMGNLTITEEYVETQLINYFKLK